MLHARQFFVAKSLLNFLMTFAVSGRTPEHCAGYMQLQEKNTSVAGKKKGGTSGVTSGL